MIIEKTMYGAHCDKCKIEWDGWDGISFWADKSHLIDQMLDDEWLIDGEKTYCPNCADIDDAGNITLKTV